MQEFISAEISNKLFVSSARLYICAYFVALLANSLKGTSSMNNRSLSLLFVKVEMNLNAISERSAGEVI